jgi:arabinogalactan oligomer/maltooligosaccharide transport system substrate-binding protein
MRMKAMWLVSMVLAVSACGNGSDNTKPDMASGGISGNLTLWHGYHAGGQEEAALTQVMTTILAANPNLEVNVVNIDYDHLFNSWEQQVQAGGGPDLFVAPNDNLGAEVRNQYLADVTANLDGRLAAVSPLAVAGMTYGGHIYGVPMTAKAVALYYNKSKVPTPPTTTDELKQLVANGAKLIVPQNPYHPFGFWGAFGGAVLDSTGKCTATQNGGVANALQYLVDLRAAGAILSKDGAATDTAFQSGNADMILNGPWVLGDYRAALGDKLGVVSLPSGTAPAQPLVGVDGWYFNPNSTNKAAAVELALLLSNAESQKVFGALAGDPPVRTDVQVSDALVTGFQNLSGMPRPQTDKFGNYWGPFGTAIDSVLDTTAPVAPATAAQTACAAMDQANGF